MNLVELDLSNNNLQGGIPEEIGNLKQLDILRLSSNKLTGEIPATLGQYPVLTKLQMDQNFLVGDIPITLGFLMCMDTLNLSHNNLSGHIPLALSDLQFLSVLDLSYNHLEGEVPRKGVFKNATAVYLDSNWGLCGGSKDLHMPLCHTISPRTEKWYYLVRALIPLFSFMSILLLILFVILQKKGSRRVYLWLPTFEKKFPKVSYRDLAQATGNFSESNLIGYGCYSSIYKGRLGQVKMELAIKILDTEEQDAEKSFLAECELRRNIRHRNILPLVTACSTIDNKGNAFKALIYEFMPNGNMDTWLHHRGDRRAPECLGITQRINTAINIADALAYLHHDTGRPIVHCDLKPSNILLDVNMNAYLGDFGIARLHIDSRLRSVGDSSSVWSTSAKGTIGYMAPEYAGADHTSTFGDVYSFGIVLLEMLTGKRPTDNMFRNGVTIITFVERKLPNQILDVIDTHLLEEFKAFNEATVAAENLQIFQCLLSLLRVALLCTHQNPRERINMREVAARLTAIKMSYVGRRVNKGSTSFKRLISWASHRS
ncbi:unnamed protein product [Urochloa humidicola]